MCVREPPNPWHLALAANRRWSAAHRKCHHSRPYRCSAVLCVVAPACLRGPHVMRSRLQHLRPLRQCARQWSVYIVREILHMAERGRQSEADYFLRTVDVQVLEDYWREVAPAGGGPDFFRLALLRRCAEEGRIAAINAVWRAMRVQRGGTSPALYRVLIEAFTNSQQPAKLQQVHMHMWAAAEDAARQTAGVGADAGGAAVALGDAGGAAEGEGMARPENAPEVASRGAPDAALCVLLIEVFVHFRMHSDAMHVLSRMTRAGLRPPPALLPGLRDACEAAADAAAELHVEELRAQLETPDAAPGAAAGRRIVAEVERGELATVQRWHRALRESRLPLDASAARRLLEFYGECRAFNDVRQVLRNMRQQRLPVDAATARRLLADCVESRRMDVFRELEGHFDRGAYLKWLVQGYVECADAQNVERTWREVKLERVRLDKETFARLKQFHEQRSDVAKVRELTEQMDALREAATRETGEGRAVDAQLIMEYSKSKQLDKVEEMAKAMQRTGAPLPPKAYSLFIKAYASAQDLGRIQGVVRDMQSAGVGLDGGGYKMLLQAFAQQQQYDQMQEVMGEMRRMGHRVDGAVYDTLVRGYEDLQRWDKVREVVEEMEQIGLAVDPNVLQCMKSSSSMQSSGSSPPPAGSDAALNGLLQEYIKGSDVLKVKCTWQEMQRRSVGLEAHTVALLQKFYKERRDGAGLRKSEQHYTRGKSSEGLVLHHEKWHGEGNQVQRGQRQGDVDEHTLDVKLIMEYSKSKQLDKVEEMAKAMQRTGAPLPPKAYSLFIKAYASAQDLGRIQGVVRDMQSAGVGLDGGGYKMLLQAFAQQQQYDQMQEVMGEMRRMGHRVDGAVYDTLVRGYEDLQRWDKVREVVEEMEQIGLAVDPNVLQRMKSSSSMQSSGSSSPPAGSDAALNGLLQEYIKGSDVLKVKCTWQEMQRRSVGLEAHTVALLQKFYKERRDGAGLRKSEQHYTRGKSSEGLVLHHEKWHGEGNQVQRGQRQGDVDEHTLDVKLIMEYSKSKQLDKVEEMAKAMQRTGAPLPPKAYSLFIKAYASAQDLGRIQGVVRDMQSAGVGLDGGGYKMLLQAFAQQQQYDQMQEVMGEMRRMGHRVDGAVYDTLVRGYEDLQRWDKVREVVVEMEQAGIRSANSARSLHRGIAACRGDLQQLDALYRSVQLQPQRPDAALAFVSAYAQAKHVERAAGAYETLLAHAQAVGTPLDAITFNEVIRAYGGASALAHVRGVVRDMRVAGVAPRFVGDTMLMRIYAESQAAETAERAGRVTTVGQGQGRQAGDAGVGRDGSGPVRERGGHQRHGGGAERPHSSLIELRDLCEAGDAGKAEALLVELERAGRGDDMQALVPLIELYGRLRQVEKVDEWRERAKGRTPHSVALYNAFVGAYSEAGRPDDVSAVLQDMRTTGVAPGVATYRSLVPLLRSLGQNQQLEKAEGLLREMGDAGLAPPADVYQALVQVYTRAQLLGKAQRVRDEMLQRGMQPTAAAV